jgi:phage repressor protein C with HTH and peptisase S24 domain
MGDNSGERLALFRNKLGLNQRDFAAKLGFSPGRIGSIETGAAAPSRNFCVRISERYNVNADWLLYGRGEMLHDPDPGFLPADSTRPRILPPDRDKPLTGDFSSGGEEFSLIRRFDVSASAGPGAVVETENVIEQIAFTRTWMNERGLSSDLSGLVKAKGVSMEPTIPDGALMLVGFNIKPPLDPGIYIFRHDDELFVKHLTVLECDAFDRPVKILVASQNVTHPPKVLEPQDDQSFRVIARVISVITDI